MSEITKDELEAEYYRGLANGRKMESRRHLRELSGMCCWQPIETAPKDGTLVLIGKPTHCQIAKYEDGWWVNRGGVVVYTGYSHWMPLPELPTE